MRNRLDEQLEQLSEALIRMGALCEEAIAAAAGAYLEGDRELGKTACRLEQEIDQAQRDIEGHCMKLLLRQHPVAGDLRVVSAAMRMISDMERIGDQAADIAEIAAEMEENDLREKLPIGDMAREAVAMVTDSVDAFVRRDLELAHRVILHDDRVDDLFDRIREELTGLMATGERGRACLDVLMIAKYYERIGDHACNIAQWVEYAVTGEYEED